MKRSAAVAASALAVVGVAGGAYLVTPPETPTVTLEMAAAQADDHNCEDFPSRAALMVYWNTNPDDPSKLDEDDGPDDGVPCENYEYPDDNPVPPSDDEVEEAPVDPASVVPGREKDQ